MKQKIYKGDLYNSSTVTSNNRSKYDETEKERTKEEEMEEQFLYKFQYNQGDKDLEPYFVPKIKKLGGNIKILDVNDLRRAFRIGILTCTGIKLYSALLGDDWRMREAAVTAFIEFIENPLPNKYLYKSFPLFKTCIEICKIACDDKIIHIFIEGVKLLKVCLAPPVCGKDVEPNYIQKSVNYFLPLFIKKLSEVNHKQQREFTFKTIIDIFTHPALNVGDLVKSCLDKKEINNGFTSDKQPPNVLGKLELILNILDEFGINEKLWDWRYVLDVLIIPSLSHPKKDCRIIAEEVCVILYKFIGSEIRNIINSIYVNYHIRERLINKFNEVDKIIKNIQK